MEQKAVEIDNNNKTTKGISVSNDVLTEIESYAESTRRSFSNALEYLAVKGLEVEKNNLIPVDQI